MSYPTELELEIMERSRLNVELEIMDPILGALCERVRATGVTVQHVGELVVYVSNGDGLSSAFTGEYDLNDTADILALARMSGELN